MSKEYYEIWLGRSDHKNIQVGVCSSKVEAKVYLDLCYDDIKSVYPSFVHEGSLDEPGPIHCSVMHNTVPVRFTLFVKKVPLEEARKSILIQNIKEMLKGE